MQKKSRCLWLTDLNTLKGFVSVALSGEVWIMVFATSKGKTADQHCNVETALVRYPISSWNTIERKTSYSNASKATSENTYPHINQVTIFQLRTLQPRVDVIT